MADVIRPQMKDLPPVWVKKTSTLIFAWDVGKDGILSDEDFETIADRIIKSANLKGVASDRVCNYFKDFNSAFKTEQPNIFRQEWHNLVLDAWLVVKTPNIKKAFATFYAKLFQALDFNGDGYIEFYEYLHWWKALDLDPSVARLQFDYMDTNHDDRISVQEFVDAAVDYNINYTDENTSNRFFGPLNEF